MTSLLEAKNILPSPVAAKHAASFESEPVDKEEEEVVEVPAPVSAKKRGRKSLQPKTPEATEEKKKPRSTAKSTATAAAVASTSAEAVAPSAVVPEPVISAPAASVEVGAGNYNSASLKVPSTQELRDNDLSGELAGFWEQCREALSFCCATLYPLFLAVIVLAYLLHFTTQQRVFASFAVVFTILSGLVLGFFFVAVVPFVVLTRTVERFLVEKDRPDSVFVSLLTRIALLLVSFGALFFVQSLA